MYLFFVQWPLELRKYLGVNATAVPSLKFMKSVINDELDTRVAPPDSVSLVLFTILHFFLNSF